MSTADSLLTPERSLNSDLAPTERQMEKLGLECKKLELEQEKLSLELQELRKPWWKKTTHLALLIPTILGIAGLIQGFRTGYFDILKVKLEAEAAVQKKKEGELSDSKKKLETEESRQAALRMSLGTQAEEQARLQAKLVGQASALAASESAQTALAKDLQAQAEGLTKLRKEVERERISLQTQLQTVREGYQQQVKLLESQFSNSQRDVDKMELSLAVLAKSAIQSVKRVKTNATETDHAELLLAVVQWVQRIRSQQGRAELLSGVVAISEERPPRLMSLYAAAALCHDPIVGKRVCDRLADTLTEPNSRVPDDVINHRAFFKVLQAANFSAEQRVAVTNALAARGSASLDFHAPPLR